ncbi:MAG: hypothetical protein OXN97_24825 [Bryobacterales bacterium]|nr:hypothetical protein [Bryobacterales bacterium]MDE0625701.1 hypothetical protein [Bryobacterales bacterium]
MPYAPRRPRAALRDTSVSFDVQAAREIYGAGSAQVNVRLRFVRQLGTAEMFSMPLAQMLSGPETQAPLGWFPNDPLRRGSSEHGRFPSGGRQRVHDHPVARSP